RPMSACRYVTGTVSGSRVILRCCSATKSIQLWRREDRRMSVRPRSNFFISLLDLFPLDGPHRAPLNYGNAVAVTAARRYTRTQADFQVPLSRQSQFMNHGIHPA